MGGTKPADATSNADSLGLSSRSPLFELETESQSSFDTDAQIFDLSESKDSLPAMEEGEEIIEFGPAERDSGSKSHGGRQEGERETKVTRV